MAKAQILAVRDELLHLTSADNLLKQETTLGGLTDLNGQLAKIHAALPVEQRNYAVIRNYLTTVSALFKKISDYPKCLGESKEILPEEFPFPQEDLCDLFADCFEKLGNLAGRASYESDRLAHLQSVWEVNGKKPEDAEKLKAWSEKAHATRERSTKFQMEGQDKIVTEVRKWLNFQTRSLPAGSPPEQLLEIKAIAKQMEVDQIKEFNDSMSEEYFPTASPFTAEELATDPVHLLALKAHYLSIAKDTSYKKGDKVYMNCYAYATVDADACNCCGAYVPEEKALLCEKDCKGQFKGSYCSVNCRDRDATKHAVICCAPNSTSRAIIHNARSLLRTPPEQERGKKSNPTKELDVLSFQLYLSVVAFAKSANANPADFPVLNEVIRAGLECATKERVGLLALRLAYETALQVCRINPFDPRHDFYTHAGLILGLRKFAVPVIGDRDVSPMLVNPAITKQLVAQSNAAGAALYSELVFAKITCWPNMELVSGVEKRGDAPFPYLLALQDIAEGEPKSFCFASRVMMDPTVRRLDNLSRRIYCECDFCMAQETVDPEVQLARMKGAVVAEYRRAKSEAPAPEEKKATDQSV